MTPTLTVKEAAAEVGVSPRAVYHWKERGLLEVGQAVPNSEIRINPDDLWRCVEQLRANRRRKKTCKLDQPAESGT